MILSKTLLHSSLSFGDFKLSVSVLAILFTFEDKMLTAHFLLKLKGVFLLPQTLGQHNPTSLRTDKRVHVIHETAL